MPLISGTIQALWDVFLLVPAPSQFETLFQVWHDAAGLKIGLERQPLGSGSLAAMSGQQGPQLCSCKS